MGMKQRIHRLEQKLAPPAPASCPHCGGIDWSTGTGRCAPGLVLPLMNGFAWCCCKCCGTSYRATLTPIGHDWFTAAGAEPCGMFDEEAA